MKNLKIFWMLILIISGAHWGLCQEAIEPIHLMKVKEIVSQKKIPYVSYVRDEIQKGYVEKEAIYPIATDLALPQGSVLKVVFINTQGVETSVNDIELQGEAIFDIERLFATQDPLLSIQDLLEVEASNLQEKSYFIKTPAISSKTSSVETSMMTAPVAASLSATQTMDYEAGLWLLTSRLLGQVPDAQQDRTQDILNSFALPKDIK